MLAQIDPATMATLSKLSPDQKQQLMKQYGTGGGSLPQSDPTAEMPNRSVKVEQPEEESFDSRSDFLGDLNTMERMISADVSLLQTQLNEEDSSEDNELLEALEESKHCSGKLRHCNAGNRKARKSLGSPKPMLKPFGYDLFASDPYLAPGNEVPIPSDYRIGREI